jgi:alpha-galactosidase
MRSIKFSIVASAVVFMTGLKVSAQKFEGLASTPPMGWNSWNKYACEHVNEKVIREAADALVSTGMRTAGYQYLVIDDCWQVARDSAGNIIADPVKFPSGIKALADYVHSKGLKFGIYTCAGRKTCAGRPSSRGYEFQDARQYAAWGVDFVKEDWCNTSTQDARESYTLMRDALYQAGRPMVFSICEWGVNKPWLWAGDVGHMWRTCYDIGNRWDSPKDAKGWTGGVLPNLDLQAGLEKYAGPGRWNDPDMLELGNGQLTTDEERAHFTLWCMLSAPLMAGNDLAHMEKSTLDILTHRGAIAIDQDALGVQGYKIADSASLQIFCKPLSGNDTAVCLFNRAGKPVNIVLNWQRYGFSSLLSCYDVWAGRQLAGTNEPLRATIPSHGVVLVRLSGRRR